ncbi:MAG: class I SAM-dependent methyltransferase [Bdellovibrio sp.]
MNKVEHVLDSADTKGIKNAYLDSWLNQVVLSATSWGEKDVVEIGCGVGRIARSLNSQVNHYTGYDISTEFIDAARELRLSNSDFEVVSLDHPVIKTADRYLFVWVLMYFFDKKVIEHYVDLINSKARPGARIILFEQLRKTEVIQSIQGVDYCIYRDLFFYEGLFSRDYALVQKKIVSNRQRGIFWRALSRPKVYARLPGWIAVFASLFVSIDNFILRLLPDFSMNSDGTLDVLYVFEKRDLN